MLLFFGFVWLFGLDKRAGGPPLDPSRHARAPEQHEAVFDFGESRVSVPRELLDTAGQLQKIDVDMKLDVFFFEV